MARLQEKFVLGSRVGVKSQRFVGSAKLDIDFRESCVGGNEFKVYVAR